ncbi:MAG TPA: NADH-quinone oxidoreductase subunit L, partial [Roseiarcus sp.]|nr:NADH-quinone oxidoreductase subunit L [Roseiarcus sp.]
TLAITGVGIPFTWIGFAGYVSKDPIIEAAFASQRYGADYAFWCVDLAAGLTSFYSWRLIFMTFFGERGQFSSWLPAEAHNDHGHGHDDHGHGDGRAHESPPVMLIPLAVLALGAAFAGVVFRHFFIGSGYSDFWRNALFLGQENDILEQMEHVPALVSLSPTIMMLAGLGLAYYFYLVDRQAPERLAATFPGLYRFLLNKWYFDELYDLVFVRPAFAIGRFFWKGGDGAIIDGLGPDGVSARVLDVTRGAVRLQSGYVYQYAFAMLLGAAALATWYLFWGTR